MLKRNIFLPIFSMLVILGCSLGSPNQSITEKIKGLELKKLTLEELTDYILREKFDTIVPLVMRERGIDMWMHIVRTNDLDPLGHVFGSDEGIFVFTDRGQGRIERAFFGYETEKVQRSKAYDLVMKPDMKIPLEEFPSHRLFLMHFYRAGGREWPGGEKTELDFRFKGLDEFVAERDPQKIAVNYLEEVGSAVLYEIPRLRPDGISHTDYNLLVKKLGDKYAKRLVSSEYLVVDYLARPVLSEFEMYTRIRSEIHKKNQKALNAIVIGQTKVREVGEEVSAVDKNGKRRRRDYVIQGGELLILNDGYQSGGFLDPEWKYGNYHEVVDTYAYVLQKGETEPPAHIKRLWSETLKVRKIIEDNVKLGRTAGETYELLKEEYKKAGMIHLDVQKFDNDLDPGRIKLSLDMHAAGAGIYAPRIGPLGPNWQRDMKLPLYHHFYLEFFLNVPMPEWGERETITLRFHDGALVTENGLEYFFPPPSTLILVH
ncbi:MAG: hypothetical protein JSV17_04450 [Candidatus Aminicenantes bacterium]|nr:MAG: hypothetical protein JSV17_04450 [Candidatus Aminicenantes bacterium]